MFGNQVLVILQASAVCTGCIFFIYALCSSPLYLAVVLAKCLDSGVELMATFGKFYVQYH